MADEWTPQRNVRDSVAIERALDAIRVCSPACARDVLEAALRLVLDIAHEGVEGRPVGALLTIGRAADVLAHSRALILDPLAGHARHARHIADERLRGTLKQLAQLDGAFVMDDDGTVVSACRYLDVSGEDVDLPPGLGSRHRAAAAVSRRLGIVAIVASSSGGVRVFCPGGPLLAIER